MSFIIVLFLMMIFNMLISNLVNAFVYNPYLSQIITDLIIAAIFAYMFTPKDYMTGKKNLPMMLNSFFITASIFLIFDFIMFIF